MQTKSWERYLFWAVKGGFFVIPFLALYISSSMLFPFITGRNFAFRIIIELLAICWVGLMFLSESYRPRLTPLTKNVLIFLLTVTLADILGINFYRSFWSNYERMEGLIGLLHTCLLYFVASSVFISFRDWRQWLYASGLASLLVAGAGFLQRLGILHSFQGGVRVDGTIGNPAYLAAYLMFHIFFFLFLILWERKVWLKVILGLATIFELGIIYLTATRGVILAMGAVGLLTLFIFAIRKPRYVFERYVRRFSVAVFVLALLGIVGFFVFRDTPFVRQSPVLARFANLASDRTVQSRFLIWNTSWQGIKERPILGWGQENYYFVFSKFYNPHLWSSEPWFDRSHDLIFDWAIHAGVLGLLLYLGLLVLTGRNLWLAYKKETLSFYQVIVLESLLIAYFLQNLFVFDNLQTYILSFMFFAFSNFLAYGEARFGEAKEVKINSKGLPITQGALIALFIVWLPLAYFLHVKPVLASQSLIQALMYQGAGKLPETEAALDKALSYNSFGSGETIEQMASMSGSIAGNPQFSPADVRKHLDKTISGLEKLTSGDHPDAKHLLFLGSVANSGAAVDANYLQVGIAALNRGLALSPTKQQIYFELGSSYLIIGDTHKAVSVLQKAVDLDPTFPQAYFNLMLASIFAGDEKAEADAFSHYVALVPQPDSDTLERLLGAYIRVQKYNKALAIVQALSDRNPGNANYHVKIAALLYQLKDFARAKEEAKIAAKLNPAYEKEAEEFIKIIDSQK